MFLNQTHRKFKNNIFISIGLLLLLLSISSFKTEINYQPTGTDDTIFVYKTVYEYLEVQDTIPVPGLIPAKIKEPVLPKIEKIQPVYFPLRKKETLEIQAETGFSLMYAKPLFSSDLLDEETLNLKKKSVIPLPAGSINTSVSLFYKNNGISAGFAYQNIYEQFKFGTIKQIIDTSYFYKYFTATDIKIDTVWFLNLDTLLIKGDSVYTPLFDTITTKYKDSIFESKVDTAKFSITEKNLNKYTFIQIPVIYKHRFVKEKYSLSPEIGIITNIIMNSQGKTLSLKQPITAENINSEIDFMKISFQAHLGIGINYFISDNLSVAGKLFYRQSLNSLYYNYPLSLKYVNAGIYLGVNYKFTNIK